MMVEWAYCAQDNCTEKTVKDWKLENSPCNTVDNEICVFPFIYNNAKHHKCTGEDNGGVLWCSTETDESGHHIPGKQGNCKEDCPTCNTKDGGFCQPTFTDLGRDQHMHSACSTIPPYGLNQFPNGIEPYCIEMDMGNQAAYCDDSCTGY